MEMYSDFRLIQTWDQPNLKWRKRVNKDVVEHIDKQVQISSVVQVRSSALGATTPMTMFRTCQNQQGWQGTSTSN